MDRSGLARVVGSASLLAAMIISPEAAAKPAVDRCLSAYDDFQDRRDKGDLLGARAALGQCGASECPAVIQRDCIESLKELVARIPTIIPVARDEQKHDLVDVEVTVEGKVTKRSLDGREIEINPGLHRLRFTSAGRRPAEIDVLVREREKGRPVEVQLEPVTPPAEPRPSPEAVPAPAKKAASVPLATYVLGGIGVAALGTASGFGLAGFSARADADRCKPNCTERDVDTVNQRFLAADISLGVGLIALAAAAWIYLSQAKPPDASTSSRSVP
jgi:hypothetical protein